MSPSVLIVASTRAYVDTREILRIQDTAAALLAEGRTVDLLTPRLSPLFRSVLAPAVRVFTVPQLVPFMDNPPDRPSFRRFLMGVLMFLRGVALVSRRSYGILHGVNDGASVARAISGFAKAGRLPFIVEMHRPVSRCAMRRAAAIILPDEQTFERLGRRVPKARITVIPDPHIELVPDAFTFGEFAQALAHVYTYVQCPKEH